jgi:chromosome segregation ATPase
MSSSRPPPPAPQLPPTRAVDADAVRLLASVHEVVKKLDEKIDRIETDVHALRSTDSEHDAAIADAKTQLEGLRTLLRKAADENNEKIRHVSEADLEQQSTMAAAITHVTLLEKELAAIKAEQTAARKAATNQTEAIGAMAEELGVANRVELGTVKEGEEQKEPPLQSIPAVARRSRSTLAASVLGVVLLILQIVLQALQQRH